jgi:aminopeptidase N
VSELLGMTMPDLVLLNDDDLAYAKIRFDNASLKVALTHLKDIESPLARALVWGSVWDSTRDYETPASDYVSLVLDNIASETESTTLRTTLNQLVLTTKQYVAPARRGDTLTRVGDALWSLAESAEAASDAQFQFVKFFAHLASTDEHFARLQGLRDGSLTLPGLVIDTDLRWEILEGLALGNKITEADIDAALAEDNTANGQQAAARARATFPTAAAKQAAFSSVVDSDTLPNAIVRAATIGYQHTNDPSSLLPLVERYFASLTDLWSSRSYHIAATLIVGLYPAPLASAELRDATRAWLDANPEPVALHRLVLENLAGVERALAVQARDK